MTPTNEAAERLMIRALRYLDEQVLASGRFELREPSAVLDAGDQDPPERAVLLIRKALAGRGEMRQRIHAIERQAAERPDWDTALRQRHSFNDGTLFDWAACPSENHAADLHALLAAPSLLQERDRLAPELAKLLWEVQNLLGTWPTRVGYELAKDLGRRCRQAAGGGE